MSLACVDKLVKLYLTRRGYSESASLLAQAKIGAGVAQREASHATEESEATTLGPADTHPEKDVEGSEGVDMEEALDLLQFAESIIVEGLNGGLAATYTDMYDSFRSWAGDSLDTVKTELLAVCFPLFVHCYIGMIRKDYQEEARTFLDKFGAKTQPDFVTAYREQIGELQMLTDASQLTDTIFLDSCPFIKAVMSNKFRLQASPLGNHLLVQMLGREEMLLAAIIVNESISIELTEIDDFGSEGRLGMTACLSLPGYSPTSVWGQEQGTIPRNGLLSKRKADEAMDKHGQNGGGGDGLKAGATLAQDGKKAAVKVKVSAPAVDLSVPGGGRFQTKFSMPSLVDPAAEAAKAAAFASSTPSSKKLKTKTKASDIASQSDPAAAASSGSGPAAITPAKKETPGTPAGQTNLKAVGAQSIMTKVTKEIIGTAPVPYEWLEHVVGPQVILSGKKRGGSGSIGGAGGIETGGESGGNARKDVYDSTAVGSARTPSVIFATVANAYDDITCMRANDDMSCVVAGGRSHSVKVWSAHTAQHDAMSAPTHGNAKGSSDNYWGSESGDGTGSAWFSEVLPAHTPSTNGTSPHKDVGGQFVRATDTNGSAKAASSSPGRLQMIELFGHSKAVYGVSPCEGLRGKGGGSDRRNGRISSTNMILSCAADETVRLWDVSLEQCVAKYVSIGLAWDIAYSPITYYFATANADKCAYMYSTDRSSPLRIFSGHVSDVNVCKWHGNPVLLATGSDDKSVRLWDVRSAKCVRVLTGSPSSISCIACSPSGTLLAAGSDGGSTLVWDLGTGRAQTLFKGHTGPVYSASFSQCSTTLATGGADCAVRTWEVHTKTKAEKSKSGHGSGGVVKVEKSVSQNTLSGSDNKKMQVGGAGPISGNANQSMLSQTLRVVSPLQSFYTKCTPVHHVRFSSQNLVCAAGPFSLASASTDSYTGASAPKSA